MPVLGTKRNPDTRLEGSHGTLPVRQGGRHGRSPSGLRLRCKSCAHAPSSRTQSGEWATATSDLRTCTDRRPKATTQCVLTALHRERATSTLHVHRSTSSIAAAAAAPTLPLDGEACLQFLHQSRLIGAVARKSQRGAQGIKLALGC